MVVMSASAHFHYLCGKVARAWGVAFFAFFTARSAFTAFTAFASFSAITFLAADLAHTARLRFRFLAAAWLGFRLLTWAA
jgi:hypothetical protein